MLLSTASGGEVEKPKEPPTVESGGDVGAAPLQPPENSLDGDYSEPTEAVGAANDSGSAEKDDEDLKHPPHIHAIDVMCSKTMMTINIEFNRQYDGVIYSKVSFYQLANVFMCETPFGLTIN